MTETFGMKEEKLFSTKIIDVYRICYFTHCTNFLASGRYIDYLGYFVFSKLQSFSSLVFSRFAE